MGNAVRGDKGDVDGNHGTVGPAFHEGGGEAARGENRSRGPIGRGQPGMAPLPRRASTGVMAVSQDDAFESGSLASPSLMRSKTIGTGALSSNRSPQQLMRSRSGRSLNRSLSGRSLLPKTVVPKASQQSKTIALTTLQDLEMARYIRSFCRAYLARKTMAKTVLYNGTMDVPFDEGLLDRLRAAKIAHVDAEAKRQQRAAARQAKIDRRRQLEEERLAAEAEAQARMAAEKAARLADDSVILSPELEARRVQKLKERREREERAAMLVSMDDGGVDGGNGITEKTNKGVDGDPEVDVDAEERDEDGRANDGEPDPPDPTLIVGGGGGGQQADVTPNGRVDVGLEVDVVEGSAREQEAGAVAVTDGDHDKDSKDKT